jgi:predicted nucleic acid-binding protein
MSVTVADASAIAAVLFDEPEAAPIAASILGDLVAPTLLLYELASVCTTKLARTPGDAGNILQRYQLLWDLDIVYSEPDWRSLPDLALKWKLSAYDAAYLQLAIVRNARLVTLDARLARAYDEAVS